MSTMPFRHTVGKLGPLVNAAHADLAWMPSKYSLWSLARPGL